MSQLSLFDAPSTAPASRADLPDGLTYHPELVTPAQAQDLVAAIASLPFAPFAFRGYLAARRVVSFGWRYDFTRRTLEPTDALPGFLLQLREVLAAVAGLAPEAFEQALVSEYSPGAGIGWHRDRPEFGHVAGVSLLSACPLRLRRRLDTGDWARARLSTAPRSAYVLHGAARSDWEHSIAPVTALRYSVPFRTLR